MRCLKHGDAVFWAVITRDGLMPESGGYNELYVWLLKLGACFGNSKSKERQNHRRRLLTASERLALYIIIQYNYIEIAYVNIIFNVS